MDRRFVVSNAIITPTFGKAFHADATRGRKIVRIFRAYIHYAHLQYTVCAPNTVQISNLIFRSL